MTACENYWIIIFCHGSGNISARKFEELKSFFLKQFPELEESSKLTSQQQRQVSQKLHQLYCVNNLSEAGYCLRCYISHYVFAACRQIVERYKRDGRIEVKNLCPYVLYDTLEEWRSPKKASAGVPWGREILESYNPNKNTTISTWTFTKTNCNKFITQVLQERGIIPATDWSILNDLTIGKLTKILEAWEYTPETIQQECLLLDSYHEVYTKARMEAIERKKTLHRCSEPSTSQLEEIALKAHLKLSTNDVIERLRQLAGYKREATSLSLKTIPMPENHPEAAYVPTSSPYNDTEIIQEEIQKAIHTVVQQTKRSRHTSRHPDGGTKFIQALKMYYVDELTMTEIAIKMELEREDQVSRLLMLRQLRQDIVREIVAKLIEIFHDPSEENLQQVQQRVEAQLNQEATEARREETNPHRQVHCTWFNQQIYIYLTTSKQKP